MLHYCSAKRIVTDISENVGELLHIDQDRTTISREQISSCNWI